MKKTKFKQTEIGIIPEDWEVRMIGDFLDVKHGFAFKGEFFSDNETDNILLTPGNFNIGGGFKKYKLKYTTEEPPKDYILEKGDIIVTMTDLSKKGDTLGYSAKIPQTKNKKYLHNQRIGLVKFKSDDVYSDFIYWVFRTKKYNLFVVGSATGSTVKHTSPNRIKLFEFGVPSSIEEQSAIAKILSDLDSKIELNQQMNKTLEAIGQAIFNHWFINFEFPNEKGKPYKSEGGEMVDSELGKIPKGWNVKSIDEIAEFLNGLALQKYPAENDNDYLPVIKIRELKQGLTESSDKASTNIPEKYIIEDGDILFSWSGSLEVVIWASGKGALNQHLFKVSSENYPKWFYYQWTLHYLPEYKLIAEGKATTMGHIQRHHLKDSLVLIPDKRTLAQMDKLLSPLINKIIALKVEMINLSQIRDSLLPKLMSGKIRVPIEVRI